MSAEPEIVRATVRGVPNVVAIRRSAYWFTTDLIDGCDLHPDDLVADRVPLRLVDESTHVVIDPEDDEQVDAIRMGSLASASFLRGNLRSMLKPIEPPIPPKPEGDFIAVDKDGCQWSPLEVTNSTWDVLWRDHGPLTVYRPEVRG